MHQQIAGSAKPSQERGYGHRIDEGEMRSRAGPCVTSMTDCVSGTPRSGAAQSMRPVSESTHVQVLRQVEVEMKAAQPTCEREHTEAEAHDKTNQKEQFPVHVKPRLSPPRSSLLAA